MSRRTYARAILRATTVATVLATAAAAALIAAPASGAATRSCWYDLPTGRTACFSSYDAVITDLEANQVVVPGASTTTTAAGARATQAVAAVTADASYVIGTVYADANYGGDSYTYTASGPCDTNADVDWEVAAVASAWDNRISSFRSFASCATKIWQTTSYGGLSYGFVTNSSYVGDAMNDRASSIQWN